MRPVAKLSALVVAAVTVLGFAAPVLAAPAFAAAAGQQLALLAATQFAELAGSDTTAADYFGADVAVSGGTAVVGAIGHADGAGRAYVFQEGAAGWRQVAELVGSDTRPHDTFGNSVAVSGGTAVVGAPEHANGTGRAYVLRLVPGTPSTSTS